MGPFPIQTERLLLREFYPEDEAAIHSYASAPEVTRFTDWGPNDAQQTRAFLDLCLGLQGKWPRQSVSLGIELKAAGKLIGGIGIEAATGVVGYVLHREHWGRGYATEASRAILRFGFETLELHRIVARCDVLNAESYRVMEKLGMRREGHFLKDALKHGRWRDTFLYAILQEDWHG